MALKNLFDMVKADRYTADGREEIIKAQEAETEDKVYQIGEISQKTGLQKTANGWVKPKNGKQPGAKENGPLSPAKRKAERIEKMYAKTQQTPEQQKADFDKSKIGQAVNKGRQEFAAEKTRQKELASKTNAIGLPKENKPGAGIPTYKESDFIGKTYGDFAKTLPRGQYTITRNQENPDGSSENDFTDIKHGGKKITVKFDKDGKITSVKQHENPTRSYQVGASNQATETKPAESKPAAGNNLQDVPDFKGMESGNYDKKLRAEGWTTGGWEGSGTHASAIFKKGDRTIRVNEGQPGKITSVQEISKPAGKLPKGVTKVRPISPQDKLDYGKAHYLDPNSEETKQADEIVNKWFESEGKEIMPDLYLVNENGEARAFSTRAGLVNKLAYMIKNDKPYDLTYISRKDATAKDAAPRVLTGDCRIRIRKEKPALTGDTKIRVRK